MDPRSSSEKEGPSSPAREAGPGHSDTPSSVISNTMPGDNQGNQQNVVGDFNTPTFHEEFLRYQVQAIINSL